MPSTQKSDSPPPVYHCPDTNHYHFTPTKHDSGWVWGRYIGNIPWYLVSAPEDEIPRSFQGPVYVRGGGNAIYHVDRLLVSGFYVLKREGKVVCCVGRYGEGMMRAIGEVEGIKQLFRKEDVSDRVWNGERYASGVEDERERGR